MEDIPRGEWENSIDSFVFNERNRNILKRRLLDGVTFDRLALEFGLSVQRVKQIVYKNQGVVFRDIRRKLAER